MSEAFAQTMINFFFNLHYSEQVKIVVMWMIIFVPQERMASEACTVISTALHVLRAKKKKDLTNVLKRLKK